MRPSEAISSTLGNMEPTQCGDELWQEPNYGLKWGNNKKRISKQHKRIRNKISAQSRRINRRK